MAVTSYPAVQPPRRFPPTLTLIGASRTLMGDQDLDAQPVRWEGGGVAFSSLPCAPAFDPFAPGCGQFDLSHLLQLDQATEDTTTLWVGLRCNTAAETFEQLKVRSEQLLDIDRHRQLEDHFWTTVLNASTDLSPVGSSPLRYALAALQEALGPCGRGFIHCTVQTAALWHSEQMLRRDGALLLDVFDNVIVPGVGYDGSSPAGVVDATGETAYAYATGMVDTRLGPVRTFENLDPLDNSLTARSQQAAIAYTDDCCLHAINVNLCDTVCGTP